MEQIHGGDIYRNSINIDFSVNVNPLGIPNEVKDALHRAVEHCMEYPDIHAEQLKEQVSKMLDVSKEGLLFGNGASEIFMAVIHTIKPKKTVIPIPSFYGYEYAASAEDEEIIYYQMKNENDFLLDDGIYEVLTEDVDLVILANPNNPTGALLNRSFLRKLCEHCKERNIYVLLDECFIEFCEEKHSMINDVAQFENLMIVRAFTKIFAIPGVRLGYLYACNELLLEQIRKRLPEWNLSCFAQEAGVACAKQVTYIEKTAEYVKQEREYLANRLQQLGWKIFNSYSNFLMIYGVNPIYEKLRDKGILIRDCSNFRGLGPGYYRIAVKTHEENKQLLQEIEGLIWKNHMD